MPVNIAPHPTPMQNICFFNSKILCKKEVELFLYGWSLESKILGLDPAVSAVQTWTISFFCFIVLSWELNEKMYI